MQPSPTLLMSTDRPGGSAPRMPAPNASRPLMPLLPRPQFSLKPSVNPKPCLVCGRPSCILASHRSFADRTMARGRSNSRSTPTRPMALAVRLPPIQQQKLPDKAVQYPIAMDSERHQLLSLWSQDWSRTRRGPERHQFPVRWIDQVLPKAMRHAALFQALLATSASMWEMARTTMSESTARHTHLADQILSQTCTNETIASQDECLLAALLLAYLHQAQGNHRETDQRYSGIVHLVVSRGGPHYLGMSGIIADMLLHVDYLQAVLLDCEPVWKLPLPALQVGIPPRLGAAFRGLMSSNTFNVEVLLAADSTCRMTDIFEQLSEAQSSASGATNSFGYLSTVSEYQLAHCNAVYHGSGTWEECICLALLLFNHVIMRNNGAITTPVRKIEQQYWKTIDDARSRGGFRDVPPCLLLWLFMTGVSSVVLGECEYRSIAVSRMRSAKISAAIDGWEHFQRRVLDDFVWVRAAQEEVFRSIWFEVEGYRAVT